MTDETKTLAELKQFIKDFSAVRDWDQFHNAKDLAIPRKLCFIGANNFCC